VESGCQGSKRGGGCSHKKPMPRRCASDRHDQHLSAMVQASGGTPKALEP
jgi:hypothetical protein